MPNTQTLCIRPDILLIEPDNCEVELGEVRLNTDLEQILADEQQIDVATGLVPHCIAILKICHNLTERLTNRQQIGELCVNQSIIYFLEYILFYLVYLNFYYYFQIARKISGRVDDVVRSMYPPLDPRLLEARAAALMLAVTHLALVAGYECGQRTKSLYFIDKSLAEMDTHLLVRIIIYFNCLKN